MGFRHAEWAGTRFAVAEKRLCGGVGNGEWRMMGGGQLRLPSGAELRNDGGMAKQKNAAAGA